VNGLGAELIDRAATPGQRETGPSRHRGRIRIDQGDEYQVTIGRRRQCTSGRGGRRGGVSFRHEPGGSINRDRSDAAGVGGELVHVELGVGVVRADRRRDRPGGPVRRGRLSQVKHLHDRAGQGVEDLRARRRPRPVNVIGDRHRVRVGGPVHPAHQQVPGTYRGRVLGRCDRPRRRPVVRPVDELGFSPRHGESLLPAADVIDQQLESGSGFADHRQLA
jgi:hypothetical protein